MFITGLTKVVLVEGDGRGGSGGICYSREVGGGGLYARPETLPRLRLKRQLGLDKRSLKSPQFQNEGGTMKDDDLRYLDNRKKK